GRAEDAAPYRATERAGDRAAEDERPVRDDEPQDAEHEVDRRRADAGGAEVREAGVERDAEYDRERARERGATSREPAGACGREHDVGHREIRADAYPVGDAHEHDDLRERGDDDGDREAQLVDDREPEIGVFNP